MTAWSRLFYRLGFRDDPGPRYYELDAGLHKAIQDLALREHRPVNSLVSDVVSIGIDLHLRKAEIFQRWQELTHREQDVAALACLGYSNSQIGKRLRIAKETAKTHMAHVLMKFRVHGRSELSRVLHDWDFSFWGEKVEDDRGD